MEINLSQYGISGIRAEKILKEIQELFRFDLKYSISIELINSDRAWENGWHLSENMLTDLSSLTKEQQLLCLQLIVLNLNECLKEFEPLENEHQYYINAFEAGIGIVIEKLIKNIEERHNPRFIEYNLIEEVKRKITKDFIDTLHLLSELVLRLLPNEKPEPEINVRKEISAFIKEYYKEADEYTKSAYISFLQKSRWELKTLTIENRKICLELFLFELKGKTSEIDYHNAEILKKLGGPTLDLKILFSNSNSYTRLKNGFYQESTEVLHDWLNQCEDMNIPGERGYTQISTTIENTIPPNSDKVLKAEQKQVAACAYTLYSEGKTSKKLAEIARIICEQFSFIDISKPKISSFTSELYKFNSGTAFPDTCMPGNATEIINQISLYI